MLTEIAKIVGLMKYLMDSNVMNKIVGIDKY